MRKKKKNKKKNDDNKERQKQDKIKTRRRAMSEAQDEPTPAGSPQARAEISPQDLKDILLLVPATLWGTPPPPTPPRPPLDLLMLGRRVSDGPFFLIYHHYLNYFIIKYIVYCRYCDGRRPQALIPSLFSSLIRMSTYIDVR